MRRAAHEAAVSTQAAQAFLAGCSLVKPARSMAGAGKRRFEGGRDGDRMTAHDSAGMRPMGKIVRGPEVIDLHVTPAQPGRPGRLRR